MISQLVSSDIKSALVTASFNERGLDYKTLFDQVQKIVAKYQDANNEIYVAGEPIVRGYGYYYEPVVGMLFAIAVGVMILILWATGGQRSRWWAPIVTGTLSAIWGLGFVGVMGYDFDPVMLVIPFILTARDMSHGIQWQGRYHDELDRLGDKFAACAATTDFMLPPGLLSILADISGIVFISFGGIPVLQHIALAGTVWLAGSLTMVFIFQPILMSYLPVPEVKHKRAKQTGQPSRCKASMTSSNGSCMFRRVRARCARFCCGVPALFLVYGSGCRPRLQNRLLHRRHAALSCQLQGEHRYHGNRQEVPAGRRLGHSRRRRRIRTSSRSSVRRSCGWWTTCATISLRIPRSRRSISFSSAVSEPFNEMFHYAYPKYLGDARLDRDVR